MRSRSVGRVMLYGLLAMVVGGGRMQASGRLRAAARTRAQYATPSPTDGDIASLADDRPEGPVRYA